MCGPEGRKAILEDDAHRNSLEVSAFLWLQEDSAYFTMVTTNILI